MHARPLLAKNSKLHKISFFTRSLEKRIRALYELTSKASRLRRSVLTTNPAIQSNVSTVEIHFQAAQC